MKLFGFLNKYSEFPPLARQTFIPQLVLYAASAPFSAMAAYAAFAMVKTFHSPGWVPWLAAITNSGFFLVFLLSDRIQRSDKIAWIVWPNLLGFGLLLMLTPVTPAMATFFALVVIASQLIRMPTVSAFSVIYRTHYPPTVRSWSTSVSFAVLMAGNTVFAWGAGHLLEHSERLLGPIYALSGLIGIAGAFYFGRLRRVEAAAAASAPTPQLPRTSLFTQIGLLWRNPGFRDYEISYLLFGGGNMAMCTVFPLFLAHEFGADHAQAMKAINVIPMITSIVMLPAWGFWLDRHNPLLVRALINALWSLAPLIYLLADSMTGVYWAVFIVGLIQGGGNLIWHLGVNYYARARDVAHYMGVHQLLTGVRGLVMPFIGYGIGQWLGYRPSMWVWLVMMLAGSGVMLVEVRREKRLGLLGSFKEREAHREAEEKRVEAFSK